jgi:hypothetical protein
MSLQQIKDSIPKPTIHTGTCTLTVKEVASQFHPRDKDYKDAGFDEDYIEVRRTKTRFHIPEHQRHYVWTKEQENKFIDTLFNNYPIPDVIVCDTEERGVQSQEDGQQRFTACWRYYNNLFSYVPEQYIGCADAPHIYYSELPKKHPPNSYILGDIDPDAKRQLDSYVITIKEIKIDESDNDRSTIISEMFERLNSGKPLTDGDKIWNRKDTPIVRTALQIGQDSDLTSELLNIFKMDIHNIITSKKKIPKTPLCTIVAMVLGLSVPFNEDIGINSSNHWANILTTSFTKVCGHLNEPNINIEYIKTAFTAICESIGETRVSEHGRRLETSENKSLNRYLGIMIYDWRTRFLNIDETVEEEKVENFKDFWKNVIEYFQSVPYDINDTQHPITSLYVDGDRKSKNTDIGKNIQSRHTQLLYLVSSWGIDYK